jgi:hypothetical protein
MFKPGMLCTGIDKMSSSKLSNPSQPLKYRGIYKISLDSTEADISMNWIRNLANKLHEASLIIGNCSLIDYLQEFVILAYWLE